MLPLPGRPVGHRDRLACHAHARLVARGSGLHPYCGCAWRRGLGQL